MIVFSLIPAPFARLAGFVLFALAASLGRAQVTAPAADHTVSIDRHALVARHTVQVETVCHPNQDVVAISIQSPLLAEGLKTAP